VTLLELDYEGRDDQAREDRIETSHLNELGDGTIYGAITYRPFKGMHHVPDQPSYMQPITLNEIVVYRGFSNRRIRWD
jgi:hypothetical protein